MSIYIGIIIFSAAALLFSKRCGLLPEKKVILLAIFIEAMGAGIGAYDYYQNEVAFSGEIPRPAEGSGDAMEDYIAHTGSDEKEWQVTVSSQKPTKKMTEKYFEKAKKEIDETVFSGKPDQVYKTLNIERSYANGMVKAAWSFSDPSLVRSDGTIDYETLEDNSPTVIYATVQLTCSDEESVYSFPFTLCMPPEASAQGFDYYMKKALKEADEAKPASDSISLPAEAGGRSIRWSKPADFRGVLLCALGPVMAFAIVLAKKEEEKKQQKIRQKELSADYPEIVSALSLYVSAGITTKAAFGRIVSSYYDRREKNGIRDRPGYEALSQVFRRMQDGEGEESAYRILGDITGHRDYSKLALMLEKNLKLGSVHLAEQLNNEEARSFEIRKQLARISGEEASTKLLAPMLMLLGVVLVVLVAPAMMNLNS